MANIGFRAMHVHSADSQVMTLDPWRSSTPWPAQRPISAKS